MKNYKSLKILSACACIALLSGCTPVTAQRGNLVEDFQMKEVKAGVHTRTDVLRIMGSPTTQSTFDPNIWYYIGQETAKHGILDPEVVKERIVVVNFDEEGVVNSLREVPSDRIDVPIESAKTPTHGTDLSVMQQLLGNLGRFNTSGERGN